MNTKVIHPQLPLSLPTEKAIVGLFLVPLVLSVVNIALLFTPTQAIELPSVDEQTLITLTNNERASRGLAPLVFNATLSAAAEAKAADILTQDYFEHVSPTGKTPWVFIKAAGYNYLKAGENLAIDFTTVEGPIPAWMNSPTHRANILKPDYEEVGIAEVKGEYKGRETTVVVQMFGTKSFSLKPLARTLVKSIASPLPF